MILLSKGLRFLVLVNQKVSDVYVRIEESIMGEFIFLISSQITVFTCTVTLKEQQLVICRQKARTDAVIGHLLLSCRLNFRDHDLCFALVHQLMHAGIRVTVRQQRVKAGVPLVYLAQQTLN